MPACRKQAKYAAVRRAARVLSVSTDSVGNSGPNPAVNRLCSSIWATESLQPLLMMKRDNTFISDSLLLCSDTIQFCCMSRLWVMTIRTIDIQLFLIFIAFNPSGVIGSVAVRAVWLQ